MKVLLFDDQHREFERFLKGVSKEVSFYFAATEDEGMRLINENDFDVIMMDGDLGDNERKGQEIVKTLRDSGLKMNIVMFSSSDYTNNSGIKAGANHIFNKWRMSEADWEESLLMLFHI